MNYSRLLFAALLLLCSLSCGAAPLPLPLAALYRQRDAAASRRDAVGSMKACAPGFAYFVGQQQPMSFARARQKLLRGYSALRSARVTTTVRTFTPAPDGVTVLARETTQGTLTDALYPSKSVLVVTRAVRDFWERSPSGTWKMKRRRLLATSAVVNGIPVRTNMPSPPH